MKRSFFCINSKRLLLLIFLFVIADEFVFCKIVKKKENVLKWKFWKMEFNFLQEKQTSLWTKSVFLQFLQYSAYSTKNWRQLQYVTNTLWKIETNHTNRLFVVWVWVNLIQLEICSYLSWGDKSAIFSSFSTLICLLSSKYCFCLCCAKHG